MKLVREPLCLAAPLVLLRKQTHHSAFRLPVESEETGSRRPVLPGLVRRRRSGGSIFRRGPLLVPSWKAELLAEQWRSRNGTFWQIGVRTDSVRIVGDSYTGPK